MSEQMNVRVSPETRRKVDHLLAQYGTLRETISIAVDRLYQSEKENLMNPIAIVSIETTPERDPYTQGESYTEFWLDPDARRCSITQEYQTGSTEFKIWHRVHLAERINRHDATAARAYLEAQGQELLAEVCNGHAVDWDGHNMVGSLSDDAQKAWDTLLDNLNHLPESDHQLWSANDLLQNRDAEDLGITAATTDDKIEEIASQIEAELDDTWHVDAADLRSHLIFERDSAD